MVTVSHGWNLEDADGRSIWSVRREDGGCFPVFSATRGTGKLPPRGELEMMTQQAIADLMMSAGIVDGNEWLTRNVLAALLLASCEIDSWEGEEWAIEYDHEGPTIDMRATQTNQTSN